MQACLQRLGVCPPNSATHWNTLQHTATYCNALQHTDSFIMKACLGRLAERLPYSILALPNALQPTATHTASHPPTHCNTLQHTATHCNALQHINSFILRACLGRLAECLPHSIQALPNALQPTATHTQPTTTHCNTHCNTQHTTLQPTTTYCSILQHKPTHCNKLTHLS